MRKIKFRAWNKHVGIMLTDESIHSAGIGIDLSGNLFAIDDPFNVVRRQEVQSDFTLMQFTGLYDNKGKEIYEDDIVETVAGFERFYVVYIEEDGVYWFKRRGTYVPAGTNFCTVLGNIHQNPELLEARHVSD